MPSETSAIRIASGNMRKATHSSETLQTGAGSKGQLQFTQLATLKCGCAAHRDVLSELFHNLATNACLSRGCAACDADKKRGKAGSRLIAAD